MVAEAVVLAGVVALLFWLLGPLRHRLERWIAARLGRTSRRPGKVIALARRQDGRFEEEGGHER